jgi:hypothetical protein
MSKQLRSWDDYMDALAAKPLHQQYADQLRVQDMVATAYQLARYGVPHPHKYYGIREELP